MANQNNLTTLLKPLFVILEISRFGRVKAIFPVTQNERKEKVLMGALNRWRSAKGKDGGDPK